MVRRDASGIELAQAPELQYNILARYEWNLTESWLVGLMGNLNFKDDTSGGAQTEDATEDYTVINAAISFDNLESGWGIQVWSRNVTDEEYYPAAYTGGNGPFVRSMGLPRTYGITFEYNM